MTQPARRVMFNVDALGALLDRALAQPFIPLLEELAPQSMAAVRAARANLPELLSKLQERATGELGRELDEAIAKALGPWTGKRRDKR